MGDKLDQLMSQVGKLPAMPHVASMILELVSDSETSAHKLQQLIDADQVLAMRILKVANSALYSLPRKVQSLQQAIVMLGFNQIRSLVLAEAIENLFKGKATRGEFIEAMLWEHSVGCAMAAKVVAKKIDSPCCEEAFIAGLTHDVGKLIMLQADPGRYNEIIQTIYNEYLPFRDLERDCFGVDHAEVGAALAERWNLDPMLAESIASHHDEDASGDLIDIVQMGNAIAWKSGWGFRNEPDLVLADLKVAQRMELGEDELEEILLECVELMKEERITFGIPEIHRRPRSGETSAQPSPQQVS